MTAPPPGLAPVRIAGDRITLRPFTEQEVAQVETRVYEQPERDQERWEFPLGPPPRDAFRERLLGSGRFVRDILDLAIEADGHLVGQIQARRPRDCTPPGVFSLGISLRAEDRGRGIGREAVRLIAGHLFQQEGAHRVEVSTDVQNGPMRAVAERLGFVLEGVMRSFMPTAEGRSDYAMYAMTRSDWHSSG